MYGETMIKELRDFIVLRVVTLFGAMDYTFFYNRFYHNNGNIFIIVAPGISNIFRFLFFYNIFPFNLNL